MVNIIYICLIDSFAQAGMIFITKEEIRLLFICSSKHEFITRDEVRLIYLIRFTRFIHSARHDFH